MSNQPNILWIVTTQWRAGATGYAGDANALTPWLDGLASEAVNYTQAVTPHPMGPQARAALLTGKLCPENGVSGYWDALSKDARTVAHALNDRGYATAFFGKWHLAERDRKAPFVGEAHAKMIVPTERRGGFGFWEGFESGFLLNDPWLHGTRLTQPKHFKGYQADVVGQRAATWIADPTSLVEAELRRAGMPTGGERPYFCVVSLEAPHPPYHAPAGSTGSRQAPYVREVKPGEIKLRANVPLGGPVEQQAREELAGYYAHIEATDRAIGKLLAEVDLTNTIVVFTSVHGDMHGSHGLFRKGWAYEESIRVPLLVRWPSGKVTSDPTSLGGPELRRAGKGQVTRGVSNDPVSLVDLPHMAVAWAEGREWHCRRDSALISMPSAMEIPLQCPVAWRGFRSAKHKLVLVEEKEMGPSPGSPGSPNGGSGQGLRPWLYFDLEKDPLELKNLAEDPARAGEIAELRKLM